MTTVKADMPASAFLAPQSINSSRKVTPCVIDPHCHIYNATDWQVAGALRGPFANNVNNRLARKFLKEIADLVEKSTRFFAISAAAELKLLSKWEKLPKTEAIARMEAWMGDHLEELADRTAKGLKGSELELYVNAMLQNGPTIFTSGKHRKFGKKFLLDAFQHYPDLAGQGGQTSRTGLMSIPGLFVFFSHIMSPRFMNLVRYQKGFTSGGNSLGIDMCFAAMLDFDYWIGKTPHAESPLITQVELMKKISDLSGGYMQPLVAYNPWTDINDNDDSIKLVETALNMGFKGVKIYPHLGYYPNENSTQAYPPDGDHPDLNILDQKLRHFFSVCRRLDVPVMTHSEESMGRFPSHNKLGGPAAWTTFFNSAHNAGTRINLAHFGGEYGGQTGPRGWTRDFADLMAEPGTEYLYGDFGLWDEFISGDDDARSRILSLLSKPVSNSQTVSDRMMFGTDWFMLTFTRPNPDYATKFLQRLIDANVAPDVLEKIFYKNAEMLFRITC